MGVSQPLKVGFDFESFPKSSSALQLINKQFKSHIYCLLPVYMRSEYLKTKQLMSDIFFNIDKLH